MNVSWKFLMEKGFDDKNSNRRGADKKDYQVDYA